MKYIIKTIFVPILPYGKFTSAFQPYNEESEENAALDRKMAALDLMEAEWRSENDPQGLSSSSLYSLTYSSWLSYGASLVTNIVQNIQVNGKTLDSMSFIVFHCSFFGFS